MTNNYREVQSELSRITAMEQRLDSMQHPESGSDEAIQLRNEIRSERSRIEAMETTLNELAELAPPAAVPAAPSAQAAEAPQPTLAVGAGIRTSYQHIKPHGGKAVDQFSLADARIYLSGDITSNISAMFNTDYNSTLSVSLFGGFTPILPLLPDPLVWNDVGYGPTSVTLSVQ